jgi:hypothetical protein
MDMTTATTCRTILEDDNASLLVLAVLASIQRECDTAIECPQLAFTSICRIGSLARQAVGLGGPGLAKIAAGAQTTTALAANV